MRAMAAPMKQCPRCAEMVLADAVACRFCGYDPAEIERARWAEAAEAERLRKAEAVASDRWMTLMLIFVVIPAVVAIGYFIAVR